MVTEKSVTIMYYLNTLPQESPLRCTDLFTQWSKRLNTLVQQGDTLHLSMKAILSPSIFKKTALWVKCNLKRMRKRARERERGEREGERERSNYTLAVELDASAISILAPSLISSKVRN